MKNIWKIMAAMLIVALPFVAAACGSDDKEDVVPTYTYKWDLNGIDLNKIAEEDQVATINARNTVNDLVAKTYASNGFTVDAEKKSFSIQTETAVKNVDEQVQVVFLTLKSVEAFKNAASVLPPRASITIQRSNTKVVNNVELYNK